MLGGRRWTSTVDRDKHFVYSVNGSVNTIFSNIPPRLAPWLPQRSPPHRQLVTVSAMAVRVRRVPALIPRHTVTKNVRSITSFAASSSNPKPTARGPATAKPPSSMEAFVTDAVPPKIRVSSPHHVCSFQALCFIVGILIGLTGDANIAALMWSNSRSRFPIPAR